jgi:hypothetical protein
MPDWPTAMRGTTSEPSAKNGVRPRRDPCADESPCCPACGGLSCLCRPRFFPGQLLTDEDLNRLQGYVLEKNKLRNRYLHGWGVACGLEVACDPCGTTSVVVRSGYALSPCGDDIVVCKDQRVDVCALIQACRDAPDPVCEPPYNARPRPGPEQTETWVLAVCYDERSTRGLTPVLGAADTCCQSECRCGGSSGSNCGGASAGCGGGRAAGCGGQGGGGCGCGTVTTTSRAGRAKTAPRRAYSPNCEPTQVCESYRWVAYPAPRAPKDFDPKGALDPKKLSGLFWPWLLANRSTFGPLLERVMCCVTRAMEMRAAIREGRKIDRAAALQSYLGYAEALQDLTANFAAHGCTFGWRVKDAYQAASDYVGSIRRAGGAVVFNASELDKRLVVLDSTWLELLAECLCSALLPPCPDAAQTNCVPLATITVRVSECRVLEVCNWGERKLLITWPTVSYWFSWLPWDEIRRWVGQLCCEQGRDRYSYWILVLIWGAIAQMMQSRKPTKVAKSRAAGRAAARLAEPVRRAMNADSLLDHLMEEFEHARAGGDAQTPGWSALAARLIDGSALAALARPAAAAGVDTAGLAVNLGLPALRDEIDRLKQAVAEQGEVIERLRKA